MRTRLAVAAASAALILAACGSDGDDAEPVDDTNGTEAVEDGEAAQAPADGTAAEPADGDTVTIQDAQVGEDAITLTVVDDAGEASTVVAARSASIQFQSEAGGQQRQRLSAWLETNSFDGQTSYELVVVGGQVLDLLER
jgi:ABC-type glycerol-3-phosphate transport system substrate-binding protein